MKYILFTIALMVSACNTPQETPRHIKLQQSMNASIQIFMESGARGSGSYIGSGQILTAFHVVDSHIIQKDRIFYAFNDVLHECTMVKYSKELDLAILKMNIPTGKHVLKFASKPPKIGDKVYSIGFHFGLPVLKVASQGHITNIVNKDGVKLMLFDAPINSGASGGAILNENFEIIGVNQMIYTRTGDWAGIGICNHFEDFAGFIHE